MPFISIIVPYYRTNKELLKKCVNSILNDPEADVELIVVDDGSGPDFYINTEIFEDNRIKIYHLQHNGVSSARNYGISVASGKWLMFVDSDDFLHSNWYKDLHQVVSESDSDLLLFSGYKDENGVLSKNHFFVKENINYGESRELKTKIMGSALTVGLLPRGYTNFYSLGSPCSKLYKLDFLRNNKLSFDSEVTFAEDTLFALEVYSKSNSIYYYDKYIYHYYVNYDSVTRRWRPGFSNEASLFFRRVKCFLVDNNLWEPLEEAYYERLYFETCRIMSNEFYHRNCEYDRKTKKKKIRKLFNMEPYKNIYDKAIQGELGWKRRIAMLLMKTDFYTPFINLIVLKNRFFRAF